jgi:hypothetical protein
MVLLALPALAAPELDSQGAVLPLVGKNAVQPDGASLILLYSGEQRGGIGPCGCDASPKGGLGRLLTVVEAQQEEPTILLNVGAWLSSDMTVGTLSEHAKVENQWFWEALGLVPFDVLHVTPHEIPSLQPHAGLVSASHRLEGVAPYVVLERGGLKVAVTGVSQDRYA